MEVIKLEAQIRETGRRASKLLKREGNVPCVLYGEGMEPVHFHVPQLSLRPLIYTNQMHTVSLEADGQVYDCIVRALDFHPVSDHPVHVDFQILKAGKVVRVKVPFHFEGTPIGQLEGGDTIVVLNETEIECLPKDIPNSLSVNVEDLQIGDTIHISDLDFPGITILAADRQTIVSVVGGKEEEEEVAEILEGEEGAAVGEEGAEGEGGEVAADDES